MDKQQIHVALLGGQEADLEILSELRRQDDIRLEFVYDRQGDAVGLEMAEIMGIRRVNSPEDIGETPGLDYVVVSEPRARFSEELRILTEQSVKILTPASALEYLCRPAESDATPAPDSTRSAMPPSINETLLAVERLLDRHELLRFLLDVAVRTTHCDAGSVMLYSPETKELYIAHATGLSERVIHNARQRLGEGIAGNVALTKRAQLIQRPSESSYKDRDRVAIGSAMSVALIWENRLLGVLNVSRQHESPRLEQPDLERMKPMARRLSRVLHESLKMQRIQVHHRETRFRSSVGEIAEKDVGTSRKMGLLARYLAELVGAETVDIYVSTHEGDWFVLSGSNRLVTPESGRVRVQRGALGRAFLEDRAIVMTERIGAEQGGLSSVSSVVYCPLSVPGIGGVMTLEFAERYRLDEFLVVREAIVTEVSRFIASELREHKLRRELESYGKVSDAAPALLACRSVDELAGVLAGVTMDILECERVSVRLRAGTDAEYQVAFREAEASRDTDWKAKDHDRFERWCEKPEPITQARLDFEPAVRTGAASYRSMITSPVREAEGLLGALTAYDKSPSDAMDDAIFGELDETVLRNLCRLVVAVIESLRQRGIDLAEQPRAYDDILAQNLDRLREVGAGEIARADRYHNSFAVILVQVTALEALFKRRAADALNVIDNVTEGMNTRTRKTDLGAWINRSTYALLTLDSGNRTRFLISRALLYLRKDLADAPQVSVEETDIRVGTAFYPGTSKTIDDLLEEAASDLKPRVGE